ncbi:zinc finger protein ZFPM1 [Rhinatrema bivittatum]|uniref:zinc finger protein ZFPM1 n=1 Tax=Rhinatrema bivittatum TaxID=194408 RepID=UPI00112D116B|nr:zinc finger protein ZFPM1 [Rhinatrema bivittatum]
MSRRKQSNPRQIKRSTGDMEGGEDNLAEDNSLSEKECGASDHEGSAECDTASPPGSEETEPKEAIESPKDMKAKEWEEERKDETLWNGPDELELISVEGRSCVRAARDLPKGLSWGPHRGRFQSKPDVAEPAEPSPAVSLALEEKQCWLARLPLVLAEADANAVLYRKGEEIWCRITADVCKAEPISACLLSEPQAIPSHEVKIEPAEPPYPATLHSEIQLLPQQAGMAAILATAVVNKDIFPCKDCGIWYRSERNLQAHLMYYCASRQSATSPSLEEKPKETYPNERVCPFPQCKKSCPSASSLEIHMRSHSGERPFVCLICLSAFTTKANCERHLKVHTDTLSGVCHGCGFVSTTRDILYSHLVTNHMGCQPGAKGEVYSPGTGPPPANAKPTTPGLSQINSSSMLKCSLCGIIADSLPSLQQHALIHMSAHAPLDPASANPSPTQFPKLPESTTDPETSQKSQADGLENGEAESLRDGASSSSSTSEMNLATKIKEEPSLDQNHRADMDSSSCSPRQEQEAIASPEADAASRKSSPRSPLCVLVKTEVASPTPGSSPVPSEPGMAVAGGTVFLPQYVFGHEAAVVPQASEILAKMSELVHSRLKQGHGGGPALYAGVPLQKGATCFECEITFNNINNYYVHKRLYCSSRHVHEDSPPSVRKLRATGKSIIASAGSTKGLQPPAAEDQGVSDSQSEADVVASAQTTESKLAEVKQEDGALKDTSSEGDSASRMSDDCQSPSSSVDELDDDPSKTLCDACNIRFSRHETYMVHKRYYCASRHDPPLRRANAGKLAFLPQPVRTRKRRKLYEIHGVGSPSLLAVHQVPEMPLPQVAGGQGASVPFPSPADNASMANRAEAVSVLPGLVSMTKAAAVPSPSSSPDAEGPIDLSKKPRLQGDAAPAPLLTLSDYHECTACRISFNSLESYLAHKKYHCPATPLQRQLQKIKSPEAGVAKRKVAGVPEGQERGEGVDSRRVKVERRTSLSPGSVPASASTVCLPAAYACSSDLDPLQRYISIAKTHQAPASAPTPLCPYCPLNGTIKGDLIEHIKNVHGLLVAKSATGHVLQGGLIEVMVPGRAQLSSTSERSPPSPPGASVSSPQQPGPRSRKDSFACKETTPMPLSNGSAVQSSSPRPHLPVSPSLPLNISPAPEALREVGIKAPTPPLHMDKSVQTCKDLPLSLPNGNQRYCRLCNIRFSSLSTFIAHKKYYCSSHTAEHIK